MAASITVDLLMYLYVTILGGDPNDLVTTPAIRGYNTTDGLLYLITLKIGTGGAAGTLQQTCENGNITDTGIILSSGDEGNKKRLRVIDTYLIIESLNDDLEEVLNSVSIHLFDEDNDNILLNWPKINGTLQVREEYCLEVPQGQDTFNIPAGTIIEFIDVTDPAAISLGAGFEIGVNDYFDPVDLEAGGGIISVLRKFTAATDLYFSGITGNTVIKIFIRKT